MSLTLTIGGSDFLPQYKTGSAVINERLGNKINSMTMSIVKKSADTAPQDGQEIVFKDGSRYLFGGFITRLDAAEVGIGELLTYDLEASSYEHLLVNKYAQKSYENQTLKAIVEDLLSTYVDSGYGLTTGGVQTGPTISTVSFNHISLRKAFEKLAKITGYEWWIGYDKVVYFQPKGYDTAPEDITDSSDNHTNLNIIYDTTQVRNSIVVIGTREETSGNLIEEFLCNGVDEKWILREKPKTMVSIEYDTGSGYSTQTYGVDPIDDDTGNSFMFNFQEKYVRTTSTIGTPASGNKVRVTYKYEVPVIVSLKSSSSINAMKAIEGGDGIHKYTITDLSIKSKDEARQRALKEIQEYGEPQVTGLFSTRTNLLTAGSIFKPGQTLTVNSPAWGINTDTQYLIQEVEITLFEDGSNIEYNYNVKFGGRLFGIREWLENIGSEEKIILDTEEIDRIEAVQENLGISETITKDGNLQSVSESLGLAETISKTNITPPFKWSPSATKEAIWNQFEWG